MRHIPIQTDYPRKRRYIIHKRESVIRVEIMKKRQIYNMI